MMIKSIYLFWMICFFPLGNNGVNRENLLNRVCQPEIQYLGSGEDFSVCSGEIFTLDASAGLSPGTYTYNWTLPNGFTQTGNPVSFAADLVAHQGTWSVTVSDNAGCTGTDIIEITVNAIPTNNSCGTAISTTTGASGTNVCANIGGGCGANSESAVYYTYTVPMTGLTSLTVEVSAPHVVSVSTACGGGDCTQSQTIVCPTPGAVYYITVSSSEVDEGNFNLTVGEELQPSTINGTVYIDMDADGTFGGTDFGFEGAPIQLLQGCAASGDVVASGTTAPDGTFSFENVPPGSYLVQIEVGAAGSPTGSSSPKNCCLTVDPCMPATLVCDLGFPPPNCTSNPYSVDNFCEDAYDNPLCDFTVIGDFACGQNPSEQGPWSNAAHCSGVYNNTSFYGFIAGTGSYQIQFTIFNCAGLGVQYGLMDVCSPGGPYVVCNGHANTGTVTVDASSLEPCKTYIFWIDGYSSSVCSYYINVTGDFNHCTIPAINDIRIETDCNPLCPLAGMLPVTVVSDSDIQSIENINSTLLYWDITFPDGSIINDLNTSIQDGGVTLGLPFTQAGEYEICVRSWHPCPAFSAPFCKKFMFESIPDQKKSFNLCADDFPWSGEVDENGDAVTDLYGNQWKWIDGPITAETVLNGTNTFIIELENKCGCQYSQILNVYYREVGDTCDDGNPATFDDMMLDDCRCRGILEAGIANDEKWYYTPFGLTPSTEIWKIEVVGDTIIQEQQYKFLGIDKGQGIIGGSKIPMARVDGKLYFYEDGKQKLFFDYNLGINDTLTYFVPKVQPYYDISSNGGFTSPDSVAYSLVIDSISKVTSLEGTQLLNFHSHTLSDHLTDANIVFVGGNIGFFGAFGPFLTAGFNGYFRCYVSNDVNYSALDKDCLSTKVDDQEYKKIAIIPNPGSSEFSIVGLENEIVNVHIFTANGFPIQSFIQISLQQLRVQVSSWPSGMYLVQVNGKMETSNLKFIKVE